jgi:hypothetical protein
MNAADRSEIEALLAEWCHCIDAGRASEAIDLFTDDAIQTMPSGTSTGREALLQGLRRREALSARTSRHLVSNLRLLEVPDPVAPSAAVPVASSRLHATWVLTLYRSDGPDRPALPQLVADVQDEYAQVAGRWRIARRTVTPVFGSA